MDSLTTQAQPAVTKLLQADEDQLYETLGIRAKAISRDLTASASFSPQVTYNAADMGLMNDVRDFGERFFARVSGQGYELICGNDADNTRERNDLINALGVSKEAAAATLTMLFVTYLGLAPAIAPVVSVLVIKLFFKPAYGAMCDEWKKNLPQEAS